MPIIMSKDEWARIQKWTDPNKEDPLTTKRREQLKLMDERSKMMTKEWPNSVENVNKRNEDVRRARILATQQLNKDFHKQYVQRKREEQERRLFEARDSVFKNKDAPKLLLSAVIESAILKERDEQLRFNEELRRRQEVLSHKGDADIFRKAKEFDQLQEERKQRRLEANKKNQLEILEQAKEVAERNRKEHEAELKMQILDNQKAIEEIETIREFEENFKAAQRARILADMDQARRDLEARRIEAAARDKMDDRLVEVLSKSKARVEAKRRQVEKEVKEERMKALDEIRNKLEVGDAARDAREQASIHNAVRQQDKIELARLQAEQEKRSRLIAERRAAHAQHERAEAARERELAARAQWEVMNRFKNQEIYEDFKEKEQEEKEQKSKEYREEILKLIESRAARSAAALAEQQHFHGCLAARALHRADSRVLAHAHALLEEARLQGRTSKPIERALYRYCGLHRLSAAPALQALPPPVPGPRRPPLPQTCCDPRQNVQAGTSTTAPLPVPAYHQHGPPCPTLLHPDTDCFDEHCETGACRCEHMK